jgi:Domain of unknown function (DUF4331)
MKKLSLLAALVAAAIAVPLSIGSSHREAPNIMLDPAADNTDTYAFTAKDAPGAVTIAANWIPGQVPANGPNFFRFDDRAKYYIHIDNTGDGKRDISYLFRFKTKIRNKESFLYAGPGTTSYSKLNVIQRYSITRETVKRRGKKERVRSRVIARGLPVAPPNIGPKTFPNYGALAAGAVKGLRGGGKVFAGSRDDPFFVDLGGTFDAINVRDLTGNKGSGKDDLSGYSTSTTVLQLPERQVTRDGKAVASAAARNAVIGVWSATERRKLEVTNAGFDSGSPKTVRAGKGKRRGRSANKYVQVSRLGNPLVNEVVIPLGQKDRFNRTTPDRDAALYGKYVVKPELAAVLNALFKINAPENNRTDIVQALLQGLPGLNQHKGIKGPPAVDTIKLNLFTPPASGAENRFGVIGGDTAGFPNGRRLGDDVVDIELQVVAGFLKGNKVPLGDGVDVNDKPFLSTFPYLAAPDSGFDSRPGTRVEPAHPPVPAGGK